MVRNNFGLHPPRSKTMVARRSPMTLRTSRSRGGKARVKAALAVIGAYVTIDVQEPHQMPTLIDTQARQFCSQLLGVLVCGKAGQPAPEGLDLGGPIQPQEPAAGRGWPGRAP